MSTRKCRKKPQIANAPKAKKRKQDENEQELEEDTLVGFIPLSKEVEEVIQILFANFSIGPMNSELFRRNKFVRLMLRSFLCTEFFYDIENGFDWETDIVLTPPVKACIINLLQSIDYNPCSPTTFMKILGNILTSMLIPRDKAVAIFLLMLNFFANRVIEGPNGKLGIPGLCVLLKIGMKFFGECINGKQPSLFHFFQFNQYLNTPTSETFEYFISTYEHLLNNVPQESAIKFTKTGRVPSDSQLVDLADSLKYLKRQLPGLQIDHLRASRETLTAIVERRNPVYASNISPDVSNRGLEMSRRLSELLNRNSEFLPQNFLQSLLKVKEGEVQRYWCVDTSEKYSNDDNAVLELLNTAEFDFKKLKTNGYDVNKLGLDSNPEFLGSLKFLTEEELSGELCRKQKKLQERQLQENKQQNNGDETEVMEMEFSNMDDTFNPARQPKYDTMDEQFSQKISEATEKLELQYAKDKAVFQGDMEAKVKRNKETLQTQAALLTKRQIEFNNFKLQAKEKFETDRVQLAAEKLALKKEKELYHADWEKKQKSLESKQKTSHPRTSDDDSSEDEDLLLSNASKDLMEIYQRQVVSLQKQMKNLILQKNQLQLEIQELGGQTINAGEDNNENENIEDNDEDNNEYENNEDNHNDTEEVHRHPAFYKNEEYRAYGYEFNDLSNEEKLTRQSLVYSGCSTDPRDLCCTRKELGIYVMCWNLYKCRSAPVFCFHKACFAKACDLNIDNLEKDYDLVKLFEDGCPIFCLQCMREETWENSNDV